ncbi:MAG: 8-amino-7-oxononanoate synthase [Cyclobacteriaceae bacterium]
MNRYQHELEERKESGLLRSLTTPSAAIDFFSNDYLGFSRSEQLYQNVADEYHSLPRKRTGSTGSRLLSGNSAYAESIEARIADFHGTESSLSFNSGYNANVGLLSALGKRGVTFVSDELIHASMIDGIRLSHADRLRFKHNDLEDLEQQLSKAKGEKIVIVESIYSMDGDTAKLESILEICQKNKAQLIVDEAHSVGVMGKIGEGVCSSLGIQNEVLATVVTFGKAMGTHGAAVLGKKWLTEYITNFSRSFIYSTAPSDHQFVSIKCAYEFVPTADNARNQLNSNIEYFNKKMESIEKSNWLDSRTSIQSLFIPGNQAAIQVAKELATEDISILPIRSPTVPAGKERLRISLHSYNTQQEIDFLFTSLEKWSQKK